MYGEKGLFLLHEINRARRFYERQVKSAISVFQIRNPPVNFHVMRSETKVTLERAARILGTDVTTLLDEIYESGITIHNDRGSGFDYISGTDFEELKESMGHIDH